MSNSGIRLPASTPLACRFSALALRPHRRQSHRLTEEVGFPSQQPLALDDHRPPHSSLPGHIRSCSISDQTRASVGRAGTCTVVLCSPEPDPRAQTPVDRLGCSRVDVATSQRVRAGSARGTRHVLAVADSAVTMVAQAESRRWPLRHARTGSSSQPLPSSAPPTLSVYPRTPPSGTGSQQRSLGRWRAGPRHRGRGRSTRAWTLSPAAQGR